MIVISSEDLSDSSAGQFERDLYFRPVDEGDVYISTSIRPAKFLSEVIPGLVVRPSGDNTPPHRETPADILIEIQTENQGIKGWVRTANGNQPHEVMIAPMLQDLFSRTRGIYETDVLMASRVLVIGLGSGGSSIVLELAKAGVGNFVLVDFDRLELANVVRHSCGISDLGRLKTKAVKDEILDKNPFAQVQCHEVRVDWNCKDFLHQLINSCDIMFCCTDNRESRTLINMIAVEEGRVCIYGGTFRRAYGGHVLKVVPHSTPCYQCFIDMMPEEASDQEISSPTDAERSAYDDRLVPIEPGLASDIAPISIMCVKIGILELLREHTTTLSSLYEDLSSCWFQWLNRREQGTSYAFLPALETAPDSLRILAWYGIEITRNEACPTCGDFAKHVMGDRSLKGQTSQAFESVFGEEFLEFPPVSE